MENKIPIFFLLGQSGSGKSAIYNIILEDKEFLEEVGMKPLVYCTTRKRRENEKDGIDYYFKTEKDFNNCYGHDNHNNIAEHRIYEKSDEGKVIYYTRHEDINIPGAKCVLCNGSVDQYFSYKRAGYTVYPIIIEASCYIRLLRNLRRESSMPDKKVLEICRRLNEEKFEFAKILEREDRSSMFSFYNNSDTSMNDLKRRVHREIFKYIRNKSNV